MQSAEEFEYSIEKCFERESDGCFTRDDPRKDAIKLIAARDAEWQARVDRLESALKNLDKLRDVPQAARELVSLLCKVNRVTAYHRHGQKVPKSALDDLANAQGDAEGWMEAYRARILDEAVERGIAWFGDQVWGCEYDGIAMTPDLDSLRAAIKGASHE